MTDIPVLFNAAEGISPIAVFSAENSDSKHFDFLDGSFSSVCAELQDLWIIYNSPFRLYPPEEKPERYKPTAMFLSEMPDSSGLATFRLDDASPAAKKLFFKGGLAVFGAKRYNFPDSPNKKSNLFHESLLRLILNS
jgi:hypothetical protein